jgi:FMN-dependent NADH-azoreductase
VSDSLVEEFLSADRYVLGVPMFNFNVPSTFKAYLDQIVRAGKTFGLGPKGYEGLVTGRKGLVITSSGGGYLPGSAGAALNFQEPYLRTILGFIGLTDLQFVTADNLNQGADAARQSRERAETALRELAATW